MRTRAIHAGDVVLLDHLGRVFYAKVAGLLQAGVLAIEPLDRRVSYRSAKAREVVDFAPTDTPAARVCTALEGSAYGSPELGRAACHLTCGSSANSPAPDTWLAAIRITVSTSGALLACP